MRERVRHSRANLLLFVVFERIRTIFFFYARVCVSLSLRARVLMSAKENAAFRRSLFSLLSAGVRLRASFSKAKEREREMENFLEASLSLWKKNLEISFSEHQIKTERERERATVSMKESIIRNDERKTIVVERASSFGRDDAFFVFLFLL